MVIDAVAESEYDPSLADWRPYWELYFSVHFRSTIAPGAWSHRVFTIQRP